MDLIADTLTEFNSYDINYVNQLIDLYNGSSKEDIDRIDYNFNLQYGNINLLPEDVINLKLIQLSKIRDYYTNPPSNNLQKFYVYDSEGNKIYLKEKISGADYDNIETKMIKYNDIKEKPMFERPSNKIQPQTSASRFIYTGTTSLDNDVTIEWINPAIGDILDEMAIWNEMLEHKIDTPKLSLGYSFFGRPVLIIQQLDKLDLFDCKIENVLKLGISILNNFKKIHTIGILNNLSVDNIGKDKKGNYHILSYATLADIKLYFGYRRTYWNNLWSAQVPETDQVTTIKYDLLELGYLMNYLNSKQLFGKEIPELKTVVRDVDKSRNLKIYEYMQYVKKNCEMKTDIKMYDELIEILKR
jgi:hypothetical protein